jgi:hypothetical protein
MTVARSFRHPTRACVAGEPRDARAGHRGADLVHRADGRRHARVVPARLTTHLGPPAAAARPRDFGQGASRARPVLLGPTRAQFRAERAGTRIDPRLFASPRPPPCAPTSCGLWFAAMAYVLVCALRRIALRHTQFAQATCGIIRLKLFKIGALVSATSRTMTRASSSRSLHRDHNELSHQEYGTEHDPSHVMFRRRPSSPYVRRPRLETPASPAGVSLLASGIPLPLCPAYASATARPAPMVRAAS